LHENQPLPVITSIEQSNEIVKESVNSPSADLFSVFSNLSSLPTTTSNSSNLSSSNNPLNLFGPMMPSDESLNTNAASSTTASASLPFNFLTQPQSNSSPTIMGDLSALYLSPTPSPPIFSFTPNVSTSSPLSLPANFMNNTSHAFPSLTTFLGPHAGPMAQANAPFLLGPNTGGFPFLSPQQQQPLTGLSTSSVASLPFTQADSLQSAMY
jgi:hypothetical protein